MTLAGFAACDQDQVGGFRLDAGPDGSWERDGFSGSDADGSNADGSGADGSDADGSNEPDGSDGGPSGPNLPGGGTEAPVFPDQPASNASCNEHDWCWVHPAPFPQWVYDLQAVEGRVFGVTRSREFGGRAGVIWDGVSMERVDLGLPADKTIQDVTTSSDGWLAIAADGTVFDVGPDGIRESITVAEDELQAIFGNSIENFVVRAPEERGIVMRDGQPSVYDDLPGDASTLQMGPNHRVWGLTNESSVQTAFNGDWRLFPRPEALRPDGEDAFGPAPGQQCTPDGPWIAENYDATLRWDDSSESWVDVSGDDAATSAFGCDPQGRVVAVKRDGQMSTYENGSWRNTKVADRDLYDTVMVGSSLYISSTMANHVVIDGERTTRVGSGFWPSQENAEVRFGVRRADIWVSANESQIGLMDTGGIYLGSDSSGWQKMWGPPYVEDNGALSLKTVNAASEIWGIDEPLFAMDERHVLEWTGSAWIDITDASFSPSSFFSTTDIAGRSEDSVWALADEGIFRYDGEAWTEMTASGTQLGETVRGMGLSSIHVTQDEQVLVAADGAFHRLQQGDAGWELVEVQSTPCESNIQTRYRDAEGTLWVAGRKPCAASLTDGEWTTYTYPDPETEITYDERARTWVEQPGDGPPLLVALYGIYEPQPDGTMDVQFTGDMMDAAYLESENITYAVHEEGVLAKFGEE
jgi:hypothetical protein